VSNKPIDVTKVKKTRGGHPVRILCNDRKNFFLPIVGLVDMGGAESVFCWDEYGSSCPAENPKYDLVEEPTKITRWCNVYHTDGAYKFGSFWGSEKDAKSSNDMHGYIKTIKVEVEI